MASMTFNEFSAESEQFWNEYLATIRDRLTQSVMTIPHGYVAYYPTAILITELPHHFAMELVGLAREYIPLIKKSHRVDSADTYLGTFLRGDAPVVINLLGNGNITGGVAFVSPVSVAAFECRFPGVLEKFGMRVNWEGDPDAIPIRIAEGSGFVEFDECLIVNSFRGAVRIRHINQSIVVGKQKSLDDYTQYLGDTFALADGQPARGLRIFNSAHDHSIQMAAQFANVFLMNQLRETTIGSYLNQHRDLILRALGGTDLISEPQLSWQVTSPDPDEHAINPDLFVRDADGYWDVYDLKLPLLERDTITIGARRRRRFVASVEEGIAQLAHYREFLAHDLHRIQARDKYGINFRDKPRFGLIVGNFENVYRAEVDEAMRRLDRFDLFDYDTLMQLYLVKSRTPSSVS